MSGGIHEKLRRARTVARAVSPVLADVLEAQNARLAPSRARDANLRALREGGAAVVTGQQVGLFLGPLYTLYKAASAIRLARALTDEWASPVVPVFWLQTEDHDLAEIAVCHVARTGGEAQSLALDVEGGSVSVAHRRLPEAITGLLGTLGEALAPQPHAGGHVARLARHYRPGAGWGEAFAGVLAELFAEEGLVLLDPRDPALAPLAGPVHRRALAEARPIARALAARARQLEAEGRSAPVHVREDSPLSFFHPDGPEGPRFRLELRGTTYVEIGRGGEHAPGEISEALDLRPACFSTSALLRPILQDTWLPTVAYVGGPAEIAYFEQLAPLYEAFGLEMPLAVPRVRIRLVDDRTRHLLARLRLTPAEACGSMEEVLARSGSSGDPSGETLVRPLVEAFDRALADAAPALRRGGERVDRWISKTRGTVARAAEKLGRNYDRALAHRDREVVDGVRRLRERLLPSGMPQERYFGMSYFAARYGERVFVERVLAAAEPFASAIEDLEL